MAQRMAYLNRLVGIVAAAVISAAFLACESADRPRTLVGTYNLINPTGCRSDIEESTLLIRGDGTYSEQVRLKNGQNESIENGKWRYDKSTRKISFSESLVSSRTSLDAVISHPAAIVVNRPGGCRYQHPK